MIIVSQQHDDYHNQYKNNKMSLHPSLICNNTTCTRCK